MFSYSSISLLYRAVMWELIAFDLFYLLCGVVCKCISIHLFVFLFCILKNTADRGKEYYFTCFTSSILLVLYTFYFLYFACFIYILLPLFYFLYFTCFTSSILLVLYIFYFLYFTCFIYILLVLLPLFYLFVLKKHSR